MSIYQPSAAPPYFPFPNHRTMAEVMEVEARIGAQREREKAYKREWHKRRKAAA